MEQVLRIIYRREKPTNLDTAQYLTICEVNSMDIENPSIVSEFDYYIQVNKNSDSPKWDYLGKPSDTAFKYLISLIK